jgi:hypothetical protein
VAGSSDISAYIGGVTTAAAATGTAASDVLANARELDNQSGMLRNAVDCFLAKVRAAESMDPEKWIPVFRERSCANKNIKRNDDSKKSHPAPRTSCYRPRVSQTS